MKKIFAAVALLALMASPALAQDEASGYIVGVGAGVTLPNGNFGDDFQPGISLAGFFSGPISGVFGWRVEGAFDKFNADEDVFGFDDGKLRSFHVNGGVQLTGHGESWSPFGYVTLGAYNVDFDTDFEVFDTESDTRFGMAFGGGVNYKLGEKVGLAFDVSLNGVKTDGDDDDTGGFVDDTSNWDWYVAPRAYVTWTF